MDINASRGMQAGLTEDKVAAVERWATSDLFTERERVALEYAEAMTLSGVGVSDALFARVRAHFSEPEIVELTAAVALENFRSKFNTALGIEAQGFCVLPAHRGPAEASSAVSMPRARDTGPEGLRAASGAPGAGVRPGETGSGSAGR